MNHFLKKILIFTPFTFILIYLISILIPFLSILYVYLFFRTIIIGWIYIFIAWLSLCLGLKSKDRSLILLSIFYLCSLMICWIYYEIPVFNYLTQHLWLLVSYRLLLIAIITAYIAIPIIYIILGITKKS